MSMLREYRITGINKIVSDNWIVLEVVRAYCVEAVDVRLVQLRRIYPQYCLFVQ